MKKNELRIGNWIEYNPNGKPFHHQINQLRRQELSCNEFGNPDRNLCLYYDDNHISPIKLTSDILEKCDFKLTIDKQAWLSPKGYDGMSSALCFSTVNEKPFDNDFTVVSCAEDGYSVPCKYLHTLQNLYFALTGEELKYNP